MVIKKQLAIYNTDYETFNDNNNIFLQLKEYQLNITIGSNIVSIVFPKLYKSLFSSVNCIQCSDQLKVKLEDTENDKLRIHIGINIIHADITYLNGHLIFALQSDSLDVPLQFLDIQINRSLDGTTLDVVSLKLNCFMESLPSQSDGSQTFGFIPTQEIPKNFNQGLDDSVIEKLLSFGTKNTKSDFKLNDKPLLLLLQKSCIRNDKNNLGLKFEIWQYGSFVSNLHPKIAALSNNNNMPSTNVKTNVENQNWNLIAQFSSYEIIDSINSQETINLICANVFDIRHQKSQNYISEKSDFNNFNNGLNNHSNISYFVQQTTWSCPTCKNNCQPNVELRFKVATLVSFTAKNKKDSKKSEIKLFIFDISTTIYLDSIDETKTNNYNLKNITTPFDKSLNNGKTDKTHTPCLKCHPCSAKIIGETILDLDEHIDPSTLSINCKESTLTVTDNQDSKLNPKYTFNILPFIERFQTLYNQSLTNNNVSIDHPNMIYQYMLINALIKHNSPTFLETSTDIFGNILHSLPITLTNQMNDKNRNVTVENREKLDFKLRSITFFNALAGLTEAFLASNHEFDNEIIFNLFDDNRKLKLLLNNIKRDKLKSTPYHIPYLRLIYQAMCYWTNMADEIFDKKTLFSDANLFNNWTVVQSQLRLRFNLHCISPLFECWLRTICGPRVEYARVERLKNVLKHACRNQDLFHYLTTWGGDTLNGTFESKLILNRILPYLTAEMNCNYKPIIALNDNTFVDNRETSKDAKNNYSFLGQSGLGLLEWFLDITYQCIVPFAFILFALLPKFYTNNVTSHDDLLRGREVPKISNIINLSTGSKNRLLSFIQHYILSTYGDFVPTTDYGIFETTHFMDDVDMVNTFNQNYQPLNDKNYQNLESNNQDRKHNLDLEMLKLLENSTLRSVLLLHETSEINELFLSLASYLLALDLVINSVLQRMKLISDAHNSNILVQENMGKWEEICIQNQILFKFCMILHRDCMNLVNCSKEKNSTLNSSDYIDHLEQAMLKTYSFKGDFIQQNIWTPALIGELENFMKIYRPKFESLPGYSQYFNAIPQFSALCPINTLFAHSLVKNSETTKPLTKGDCLNLDSINYTFINKSSNICLLCQGPKYKFPKICPLNSVTDCHQTSVNATNELNFRGSNKPTFIDAIWYNNFGHSCICDGEWN